MAGIGHNQRPPLNAAEDMAGIMAGLTRAMPDRKRQQIVADRLGITRQCVNNYIAWTRDMTLPRACQVARAAGYRLALVPVEV